MRGFDRDLIRGGHYGQRSCEPHLKSTDAGTQAITSLIQEKPDAMAGGQCPLKGQLTTTAAMGDRSIN
jgi:hypothetical protein